MRFRTVTRVTAEHGPGVADKDRVSLVAIPASFVPGLRAWAVVRLDVDCP